MKTMFEGPLRIPKDWPDGTEFRIFVDERREEPEMIEYEKLPPHERTEARPHPLSGYKGIGGYATRKEWRAAWLHHLNVLPLDERKVIVLQTLRKHGPQASFWPQLRPALDALVREGKVRKIDGYEEVQSYQAPAVTFDGARDHLKKPIGTSESKTLNTRPSWLRKIATGWRTFLIGDRK